MVTALTFLLIITGVVLWMTVKIIPMREAGVVERLGKFKRVLNPGIHFLIPIFDRIAYRHEIREQVIDIPSQSCITRDNIQVDVDGLVYLKVMDPQRASYGIGNYRLAGINLAQTTMRSEIGKLSLGQTFAERETLNASIVKEIDKASTPWGVKVLRYELKNITPSQHVMTTLEKQMEAEREKRAEVTNADAEKQAMVAVSEGERQSEINISEGEKQKRINEALGEAKSIALIAGATAKSTEMIADAISKPGGSAALNMQVIERYIDTLGQIAAKSDVSVIPLELANVRGFFEGLATITGNGEDVPGDDGSAGSEMPEPDENTKPSLQIGPWNQSRD